MRSRFAHALDLPSRAMPRKADHYFSKLTKLYEESRVRYRAPLGLAILSVAFEECPNWLRSPDKVYLYGLAILTILAAGLLLCSVLAALARTSRLAIALYIAITAIGILPDWILLANHSYLALWCIPVAILFREWWTSDHYALYLRVTLGIVMIAAFLQKVLAGTYLDGSFIAYMSAHGSATERMFSLICNNDGTVPCVFHQTVSIFILLWQLTVGILLLLGLNSRLFLAIEIGFLLGAGIYADEMNFQILNVALLCIVFRFGVPLWLLAVSIMLLLVDLFTISGVLRIALGHAV